MAWNLNDFNSVALPAVQTKLVTARTIYTDLAADAGIQGGTYNVRSPYVAGPARVHTQADRDAKNAFQFDDLIDQVTPVTLSDYIYKGSFCPYDFETFELSDVKPLIASSSQVVADKVNQVTAAALQTEINAVTAGKTVALDADETVAAKQILATLRKAKTQLDTAGVPTSDRHVAISPEVAERLIALDNFSNASAAGSTDALREGTLGRIYGFEVHEDIALTGLGFVAYEKHAFGIVIRPKAKSFAASVDSVVTIDAEAGFVLNSTVSFDGDLQADKIVVGAFVGVGKLDPARSVAAKFSAAA